MHRVVFILACVLGMVGCASSRPTSTQTSNHEQNHTNIQSHIESILDSTTIDRLREVIHKNDTVYIYDSIYIYKWRDHFVQDTIIDTLYINQTDSIRIPVEVEKPIAPFVRNSCIALWSIIGVAILALVLWIVWNFATGKFSFGKLLSLILRR